MVVEGGLSLWVGLACELLPRPSAAGANAPPGRYLLAPIFLEAADDVKASSMR